MKTEFTHKEIYESYQEEVIACMVGNFKIPLGRAKKIIEKENFENKFINNIDDYEFMEPSKIALQLIVKNARIAGVQLVRVKRNGRDEIVIIHPRKSSLSQERGKGHFMRKGFRKGRRSNKINHPRNKSNFHYSFKG